MMSEQTFLLEIHDQPDVLVRIMQVIHRRGGHIRYLKVEPERPWAKVNLQVEYLDNPSQITRSLEKLVDVHRAHLVTTEHL
jgi:acetolactate synthase regulatory subunit